MTARPSLQNVGAMDPERKNSVVVEDTDDDFGVAALEISTEKVCYFNDRSFPNHTTVCSGSGEMLRCEDGKWIRIGSCDFDNP